MVVASSTARSSGRSTATTGTGEMTTKRGESGAMARQVGRYPARWRDVIYIKDAAQDGAKDARR
jgi:hypothetical protein